MIISLSIFFISLVLWGLAWHYQTKFAFGILVGLGIGAFIAQFIGPFNHMEDIPLWLPAMPLVSVVIVLLVMGIIAWFIPNKNDKK
jgi:ABC-type antimicrobial peptide transport system permease subunit|tara:strand:- start:31400 stop:31657 length:258 start_codon:yes stop_codon:yes gene_type:complete